MNAANSAQTLGDKWQLRQLQYRLQLPAPRSRCVNAGDDAATLAAEYPLVAKPLKLSASQGVIRVDEAEQLPAVVQRIRNILRAQNVPPDKRTLLLEDFVAGREYAMEAMMNNGVLHTLALFEKPEPLDGPFFTETVYVTPPDLERGVQREFHRQVELLCRTAGWLNGPVHAEARVLALTVTLLEVAPRTIGGLCSRLLIPLLGSSLESLVLGQALGKFEPAQPATTAAGVYMIPVPHPGLFESVDGIEQARNIPGITSITITVSVDEPLEPMPEGNKYVGFVFAASDSVDQVKEALVQAQRCLHVRLRRMLVPASTVKSVA
jgi:biotin carboxylase